MRFSSAVDSLTKENKFLRLALKLSMIAVLALALTVVFLYDRAPVMVERSTHGLEIVRAEPMVRTQADIQQALRLMIRARFDTDALNSELFISKRQYELRVAEQTEMKSRGLVQATVFRSATVNKSEALVEFDRVIAIGDVRSALKTTVRVAFEETEPNELNPYGLRLGLANPVERKEGK
jgi:hypothetical protein